MRIPRRARRDSNTRPLAPEFASEWFEATKAQWRETTRLDYQWQLSSHLLPFFKDHHLSQITIAEVDRYRHQQVRQASLSVTSINKTITRLGQILEVALEYGLIERNPAKGKRRRLKAVRPTPVWLDSAEQIQALLDGASELDGEAKSNQQVPRRAILATLVFAGLRIGELIDLRWRDVDLAANRITIRASKTGAGVRRIDLLPALRDELAAHKAGSRAIQPEALVFPTQGARAMNASNVRNRTLSRVVKRANERLVNEGETPLPEGLTPHKLRHTYASLLVALGVDPGAVMDQLGHTDPSFTLRVYRHGMRRDRDARERLSRLVGASTERSDDGPSWLAGTLLGRSQS